jgi:hypothetical protein
MRHTAQLRARARRTSTRLRGYRRNVRHTQTLYVRQMARGSRVGMELWAHPHTKSGRTGQGDSERTASKIASTLLAVRHFT